MCIREFRREVTATPNVPNIRLKSYCLRVYTSIVAWACMVVSFGTGRRFNASAQNDHTVDSLSLFLSALYKPFWFGSWIAQSNAKLKKEEEECFELRTRAFVRLYHYLIEPMKHLNFFSSSVSSFWSRRNEHRYMYIVYIFRAQWEMKKKEGHFMRFI